MADWLRQSRCAHHALEKSAGGNGRPESLTGLVADVRWLPWPIDRLPVDETCIDIGNHLFWPGFTSMPMIDFFLWALGKDPETVQRSEKSNRWLGALCLPALPPHWQGRPYVLFCPDASTPIRSIPQFIRAAMVDQLWQRYGIPVLGFGNVVHPHYADITSLSPDTAMFLSWIKNADFVLTADTAAVHAAAGFDVPTTAFFTTIVPDLRVRDYTFCKAVDLSLPALRDVQASGRVRDLQLVEQAFHDFAYREMPLPTKLERFAER